jgi:hypothetical protein
MKKKLIALGIRSPKELQNVIGGTESLALKVWYGAVPLSKQKAIILKKKTGASLDFLLG